jgi:hypothetical protein
VNRVRGVLLNLVSEPSNSKVEGAAFREGAVAPNLSVKVFFGGDGLISGCQTRQNGALLLGEELDAGGVCVQIDRQAAELKAGGARS